MSSLEVRLALMLHYRVIVELHPVAIAAYDKYASSHPPTNFGGRRLELELFTLPSEF